MYYYKIKIKKVTGPITESFRKNFSLLISSKKPLSEDSLFEKVDKYIWKNYKNRVDEIILCEGVYDYFPDIDDIQMSGGTEAQINFAKNIRYKILSKILTKIFYNKYFRKNEALLQEIKEKVERMTHPVAWIDTFKDMTKSPASEILSKFEELNVEEEMQKANNRYQKSNSDFSENWYILKVDPSYIRRDVSEKCHGIISLDHHMFIYDHEDDLNDEAWEGHGEGYTLIYVPKKLVKERDGKYTVILPKHSTCFGVEYLTSKDGYDYQRDEHVSYHLRKPRFNGKINLSTDKIYDKYNNKEFWPRPTKMNYDYRTNRFTSWEYI